MSALPDGSWPRLHDASRWVARWLFRLLYRLRVYGGPRVPVTGAVVLVANHSAFLDGPLLFGLVGRPTVFLVKHDIFQGGLGWFLRRIGQLPVRRGEAERAPLLAALRTLRAGGVVGVFPEGTRGTGDVAKARRGAAWLARSTGAVVLPVACRGTRRPVDQRRFWPLRPRVDVLVGMPIQLPARCGGAALTAATELIRAELAELVAQLDEIRSGAVPRPAQERARRSHG